MPAFDFPADATFLPGYRQQLYAVEVEDLALAKSLKIARVPGPLELPDTYLMCMFLLMRRYLD